MTDYSPTETDYSTIIDSLLKETLDDAIKSVSYDLGEDPFIPMAFFDSNCITVLRICRSSQTFVSVGEVCVHGNKLANYKYGENKTKLMDQIGVLHIDTEKCPHQIRTTELGNHLLTIDAADAISIMVRLSTRIPVINKLLSTPFEKPIDVTSVFPESYKYSTIKRRSSSIVHIIRDIEEEYCARRYCNRIIFSKQPQNETYVEEPQEMHPISDCVDNGLTIKGGSDEDAGDRTIDSVDYVCVGDSGVESTDDVDSSYACNACDDVISEQQNDVNIPDKPAQVTLDRYASTGDVCDEPSFCTGESDVVDNSHKTSDEYDDCAGGRDITDNSIEYELCIEHPILSKIKSFVNKFYRIEANSKIPPMFESLINIIEDPSSEYITQTFAYLPLGYFVKYGRLTKQSLNEVECACFIALLKIYEINMDLVICNLSGNFQLNDYYNLRDTYMMKYGAVFQTVKKRLCVDELFSRVEKDIFSDKYQNMLKQLHESESNLYYRLMMHGTERLDGDSFIRALQIISQSRLEYPIDGIDAKYVPLLVNNDVEECFNESIGDCILSEMKQIDSEKLRSIWEYPYCDWHDAVNELLMLAYILSPHRFLLKDDSDLIYVFCQSIVDKAVYFEDDETQSVINDLYETNISMMPDDLQIRILNRVGSILISNYLSNDYVSFLTILQDDIASITRICYAVDNNAGRKAKYKSYVGIGSSLNVFEKSDIKKIRNHRNNTDSERSRLNRYMNRVRYGYDEE